MWQRYDDAIIMNKYTLFHVAVFRSSRNLLSRSPTPLVAQPQAGGPIYNFQLGLPLSPIADSRNVTKRVSPEVIVQRNGSKVNKYLKSTGYPKNFKLHLNRSSKLLPQSERSTDIYRYLLPSLSMLLYSSRPSKAFRVQIGVTLQIQYVQVV